MSTSLPYRELKSHSDARHTTSYHHRPRRMVGSHSRSTHAGVRMGTTFEGRARTKPAARRSSSSSGSSSTEIINDGSTDSTSESEDDEEDSDYEILDGFRLGEASVIESDNETADEIKIDVSGFPVTRLTTVPGKEVFHIVSSKYQDDSLPGDDKIWSNSTGEIGGEIDCIAVSADSTDKFDPLFRWM